MAAGFPLSSMSWKTIWDLLGTHQERPNPRYARRQRVLKARYLIRVDGGIHLGSLWATSVLRLFFRDAPEFDAKGIEPLPD